MKTTKRILSLLLALAMVLSLLPSIAFAEPEEGPTNDSPSETTQDAGAGEGTDKGDGPDLDDPQEEEEEDSSYVAQIGSAKYETLAAAFAAVADGDTITMLANAAMGAAVTLPEDATITILQNHFEITDGYDIVVPLSTTVISDVITNRFVAPGIDYLIEWVTTGNTYTYTVSQPTSPATLTHGGVDTNYAKAADAMNAARNGDTVTLNQNVTEDLDLYPTDINGVSSGSVTLNMNGKTVSGQISSVGGTTLTVTGNGTVSYSSTGSAYVKAVYAYGGSGALVMQNGTVNSTGYALASAPGYNDTTATLTVNGGTYTGATAAILVEQASGKVNDVARTNGGSITINGGTFNGAIVVNAGTLVIRGGTFDHDPSAWVAEGYAATENNGIWTVAEIVYVAQVGETIYTDLQTAINAANGKTVTLLHNVDFGRVASGTTSLMVDDIEVTLDLAGFEITGEYDGAKVFLVKNDGQLTITDSSANHTGKIIASRYKRSSYAVQVNANSKLIVNGGTLQGYSQAIYISGGTVEINAGTVQAQPGTSTDAIAFNGSGTLTINGGTLMGTRYVIYGTDAGLCTITITGGTIQTNAAKAALAVCNNDEITISGNPVFEAAYILEAKCTTNDNTVAISGGDFTGCTNLFKCGNYSNTFQYLQVTISGGTYASDPSLEQVEGSYRFTATIAEGKTVLQSGNEYVVGDPLPEAHVTVEGTTVTAAIDAGYFTTTATEAVEIAPTAAASSGVKVVFDADAAAAIATNAGDSAVTLTVQNVTTPEQAEANVATFQITMVKSDDATAEVFGANAAGTATVTVPFNVTVGSVPVVNLVDGASNTAVKVVSYTATTVTFEVPHFSVYEVSEEQGTIRVTKDATTKYYTDLAAAVSEADSGSTVTLLADFTISSALVIDKALTLTSDGTTRTITGTAAQVLLLTGNGAVTVDGVNIAATTGHGIQAGNDSTAYSGALTYRNATMTVAQRGIRVYKEDTGFGITVSNAVIQSNVNNPTTSYTTGDNSMGLSLGATDNKGYSVTVTNSTIQGFSYCINGVSSGSNITVTMTNGATYGRAALNFWGNNNVITLDNVTVNGLNNQTGSSEAFACIVDNSPAVGNTYYIKGCTFYAKLSSAAANTATSSASEELFDLRGTNSVIHFTGTNNYTPTVNGEAPTAEQAGRFGLMTSERALHNNSVTLDSDSKSSLSDELAALSENVTETTESGTTSLGYNGYPVRMYSNGAWSDEEFNDLFKNNGIPSGAQINLKCDVTLTENLTWNVENGYFLLVPGSYTITPGAGAFHITLGGGSYVLSTAAVEGVFEASEGYQLVYYTADNGYWHVYELVSPVASVTIDGTTTNYFDFQDAWEAANASQGESTTLKLLDSYSTDTQLEVSGNFTLDLNGYVIEYVGTSVLASGVIMVRRGATLTVDDTDENGAIISDVIGYYTDETTTAEEIAEFYGFTPSYAYAAIALTKAGETNTADAATLIVDGGQLYGYYYAVVGNGNRHGTVITINGGELIGAEGSAIYHPQTGTLTVNNGTLTGKETAIEIRAGELNISGGTFTALASPTGTNPNGSGTTSTGAAIAVAQHNTKLPISVNITGGTFEGYSAFYESNPQNNSEADIEKIDLSISGGTFNGTCAVYCEDAETIGGFISGGSFSSVVDEDYCATDFEPVTTPDPGTGLYTVAHIKVAKIGDVEYDTLAEAVAAVPTDGTPTTIMLIADETIVGNAGVTIPATKNVVLDLNGYTLKNAVDQDKASQVIKNEGTLTIQDSSVAKTGLITNALLEGASGGNWEERNYATNVITNCGTLYVTSGTISQTANGNICYAIDNQTNGEAYTPSVTISGGTVESRQTAIRQFLNSTTNDNILNIEGGTVSGGVYFQNPSNYANKGTLNISGGEISGNRYSIYMYSYNLNGSNLDINISGGTFNGNITCYGGNTSGVGDVTITGGTFNNNVLVDGGNLSVENGTFAGTVSASRNWGGPTTLEIDGGTYNGDYVWASNCDTATITDGTFNCTVSIQAETQESDVSVEGGRFHDVIYPYGAYEPSGFISGGIFDEEINENYCAPGYESVVYNEEDDTYTVGKIKVAQIGDVKYETLAEAVAAANATEGGATIQMLENVELAEGVDVSGTVTLDLNGKTISDASGISTDYLVAVLHGGTLTVTDTAENDGGKISMSTDYCAIKMTKANDGDWTQNATLIVNGGTIEGYDYAISGNGNDKRGNSIITINGGTIRNTKTTGKAGDDAAIYQPNTGVVTLNGGTITGLTGVEVRAGSLVIPATSTVVVTGTGNPANVTGNGNGTTAYGAGIAIAQHTTKHPINATIEGGNVYGANALVIANPQGNTDDNITVAITGGTFIGTSAGAALTVTDNRVTAFVSGGSFSSVVDDDYCATGYSPVTTADLVTGLYTVERTKVAEVNGDQYTTLEDALAAVTGTSGTIKLLADVDLGTDPLTGGGYAEIAPTGKSITLDLNGKAITGGALDVYGTLTITDTSTNADGSVTGTRHGIWVNEGATLNVEAGTITTTGVGYPVIANPGTVNISGGTITNTVGAGAVYVNDGTLTIYGGTITNTVGSGAVYVNDGTLTMTAGTVTSTKDDTEAIRIDGASTATISGGTVTGHDWGVTVFDTSVLTVSGNAAIGTDATEGYAISTNGNAGQNATVNITGGTITGAELGVYAPSGTLNISGGTITGATGVYFKSKNLSITGGEIIGNGDATTYNYNGNGANPTGDALVLDNCGYPNGVESYEVSGGTFRSTNAQAVASYANTGSTPLGGFVSGGEFSNVVPSAYCYDGYVPVTTLNSHNLYEVDVGQTATARMMATLSLKENIDVNFYVYDLSDTEPEHLALYTVEVTYHGDTTTYALNTVPTIVSSGKTLYHIVAASCKAEEMGDEITIVVKYGNTVIKEIPYSVKTYCENQIATSTDQTLVNLCKATLEYGANAQQFFNYNTGSLVNGGTAYQVEEGAKPVAASYNVTAVSEGVGGDPFSKASATLTLTSEIELNFYFKPYDNYLANNNFEYEVKKGGVALDTTDTSKVVISDYEGWIVVTVKGFKATELNDTIAVTVKLATDKTQSKTITYSPMSYAYNMQTNAQVGALSQALYFYYKAAEAFFAVHP